MGDYPGSSNWALNVIINILPRESRGRFDTRKEKHYDGEVGEERAVCCKEGVTIQGTQVASEAGEGKDLDLPSRRSQSCQHLGVLSPGDSFRPPEW